MAHGLNRAAAPVVQAAPVAFLRRWWVQTLAVFLASRVVTTAILLAFAAQQPANAWTGPRPDYVSFASLWDAHWYYIVAMVPYPAELPLTGDGQVAENAWAFMPAYPWLVRALSIITAVPWHSMAIIVSVGCAAGTALLFQRLMATWLSQRQALWAVALFCFAPLSPILQVGYAESMGLLLLTALLLLLVRRRYLAMLPLLPIAAVTRPGLLAFALTLGVHCLMRLWAARRSAPVRVPLPRGELAAILGVGSLTAVLGFAWAWIAGLVTGVPDAYVATELAWRRAYLGPVGFEPFSGWIEGAKWWARRNDWPEWAGLLLLLVLVLAIAAALLWDRRMRALGPEVRIWTGAYLLYLLAVFFPQSSTWRLLLPAYPALGALAVPRTKGDWHCWLLLGLGILGQVLWVHLCWWVDGADWSPP